MFDEIENVLVGQHVMYNGVFSLKELFKFINSYFQRKGYQRKVMNDKETVVPSGKSMNVRIRFLKYIKDYIREEMQIWVNITNMTDVIKEVDGIKLKLKKGNIDIQYDALLVNNRRGRWECRAEYTIIKNIFDKFLYKPPKEGKIEADVMNHAIAFRDELYSYVNLNKFLY